MSDKKDTLKIVKCGIKDSKVIVHAEEAITGDILKTTLESDAPPLPAFPNALSDLGAYMCDLMEFPKEWKNLHRCTSISIGHEEDGRLNAVVTLYVKLAKFNNGISINSPCLREKLAGTSGGGAFMTPKMLELVQAVITCGRAYMEGERSQVEMPLDANGKKKRGKLTAMETAQGQADVFAKEIGGNA